MSRKTLLIIIAAVVGVGGFFGYQYWREKARRFAGGHRIGQWTPRSQARRHRAEGIFARQGDPLPGGRSRQAGRYLRRHGHEYASGSARGSQAERRSPLKRKRRSQRATIIRSKAQIELAKVEVARSKNLVAQRAGSQRELDVRNTALKTTTRGAPGRRSQAAYHSAGGQCREGEGRDDPDAHRRRHAAISRARPRPLQARRNRRGSGRPAARR